MSTNLDELFDKVYPHDKPDYYDMTSDGADATLYYHAKQRMGDMEDAIYFAIRHIKNGVLPASEVLVKLREAVDPKAGWWR